MMLRDVATVVAAVSSVFVVVDASASTTKKNAPNASSISGSVPRSGTLVAMNGSGSIGKSSGSRDSYIGMNILPFEYLGLKTTVNKTTVETPKTSIKTLPKTLDFAGRFGGWTVRPSLSLEADVPSSIGLDMDLSSNLEVGAFLSYGRSTEKNANKEETVDSSVSVGPQASYYTEAAGMPVEADARLVLLFNTTETTKDSTTTKTKDQSGYAFEVNAKIVRELSAGLDYFAGAGLGYTSLTDKSNKDNEVTVSGMSLTILPAGLRFKF